MKSINKLFFVCLLAVGCTPSSQTNEMDEVVSVLASIPSKWHSLLPSDQGENGYTVDCKEGASTMLLINDSTLGAQALVIYGNTLKDTIQMDLLSVERIDSMGVNFKVLKHSFVSADTSFLKLAWRDQEKSIATWTLGESAFYYTPSEKKHLFPCYMSPTQAEMVFRNTPGHWTKLTQSDTEADFFFQPCDADIVTMEISKEKNKSAKIYIQLGHDSDEFKIVDIQQPPSEYVSGDLILTYETRKGNRDLSISYLNEHEIMVKYPSYFSSDTIELKFANTDFSSNYRTVKERDCDY